VHLAVTKWRLLSYIPFACCAASGRAVESKRHHQPHQRAHHECCGNAGLRSQDGTDHRGAHCPGELAGGSRTKGQSCYALWDWVQIGQKHCRTRLCRPTQALAVLHIHFRNAAHSVYCQQEPELGRRVGMLYVVDSVLQGSHKSRDIDGSASSCASVFRNTIGAALPR
jgi:hypothetical protein